MIGFTKACHRTQGFVTEPSQKRTAREEAGAAASGATATIFAENDDPRGNTYDFQAHVPHKVGFGPPFALHHRQTNQNGAKQRKW